MHSAASADQARSERRSRRHARERQGPAKRDTMLSAAVGAPSSAPIAMASANRDRPQVGTVNPQQSDIGGGIASDELRRHRLAAGKCDGELAVLGQGFIGGDDDARRSRLPALMADKSSPMRLPPV